VRAGAYIAQGSSTRTGKIKARLHERVEMIEKNIGKACSGIRVHGGGGGGFSYVSTKYDGDRGWRMAVGGFCECEKYLLA
jgi:hypothetical protein